MLVGKIFAPKWKHRNPDVRKQALLDLNPSHKASHPIYIEMAQADLDIDIRKLALKRIKDISILLGFSASQHEKLGQDINKRMGQLIAQVDVNPLPTAAIDGYLRQYADTKLLSLVLEQSHQESLRETALLVLDKNSIYADTAMSDKSAALRLLAIEQITKISTIERVLKHSKTRDKSVYKIAKQKLDAHIQTKNVPSLRKLKSSVERLLIELNAIVKVCQEQQRWLPQQAQVSALKHDWQLIITSSLSVSADFDQNSHRQFESLCLLFQQGINQENVLQQKRDLEIEDFEPIKDVIEEYCDKLQEIITELETIADQTGLKKIDLEVAKIESIWRQIHDDLPTIVDSSYMRGTLERYQSLLLAYRKCSQAAEANIKQLSQSQKYLSELQRLVKSEKPIGGAKLAQYKKHVKYFDHNVNASVSSEFSESRKQYNLLLQELDAKLSQQSEENSNYIKELSQLVNDLDAALKNGKAKYSVNLTRRWAKLILQLDAQTRQSKQFMTLSSQYKNLQVKVGELREWREWSNLPIKEKLCQDVEILAEEASNAADNPQFNYTAAMDQLKAYRRDWNKLVDSEFKTDKSLEKKFNASCDSISRASQLFFKDLAQERQAHFENRQNYCTELDTYFEKLNLTEVSEIDLKHLDKVIRVSNKEWYTLGAVDRTKKQAINKQFSAVITKLTGVRNKIREYNLEQKTNLLQRAKKALSDIELDTSNISGSIETIKRLQSQWKNVGVAIKDGELWQQFQQTGNKVFEHRNQQNSEKITLRNQQRQDLETLCADIECLLIDDSNTLSEVRKQFSELQSQWVLKSGGIDAKAIEKRYKTVCQGFDKKIKQFQLARKAGKLAARQKFWDICVDLETLLAKYLVEKKTSAAYADEFKALQDSRESLTNQSGPETKSLQIRYKSLTQYLVNILSEEGASKADSKLQITLKEKMADAIECRKKICLHAEILADIESPTEETPARMALQVSMLANRMTMGGQKDVSLLAEITRLSDEWHLSDIVIEPIRVSLEKRFANAIHAIKFEPT